MLHEFSYVSPQSREELLSFLDAHGDEAVVFSGGTDLFVNIRANLAKPGVVVDLKGIKDFHALSYGQEGLHIGCCVTVNEVVSDSTVREHFSILHIAGSELATYQLRNRATVVGNVVTASPCGDMSSPLLVLGAEMIISSKGETRRVPIGEFITGVKKTVLKPNEIVEGILVPKIYENAPGGYKKLKRIKGHDLGLVSVTLVRPRGKLRLAISSAAPTPVLLPEFDADTPAAEVQKAAHEAISPIDDVRCTKDYRDFMVGVYIERLLNEVSE